MKQKRFGHLVLMILLLIVTGCGNNTQTLENAVTVRFLDQDGNQIAVKTVEKGTAVTAPQYAPEGKTLEGWYYDFYSPAWSFSDPVNKDLELRALCTDEVETVSSKITYQDLEEYNLRGSDANAVLVVYLKYRDGYDCDMDALKQAFTGEYDSFDRLKSVSSYLYYNSYGRADLDFHFMIYDCNMTCKEAYDINNGYNTFHEDIFNDIKKSYPGDINELDKDRDGYVDAVVFIGGEDSFKTVGDGYQYYISGGQSAFTQGIPSPGDPVMKLYIKVPYEGMLNDPVPATQEMGIRVLIHEMSHAFGLVDYYDFAPYKGEIIDALGTFDMQSHDVGDWNCFSRFTCGWLEPYLISEGVDSVTLKLSCSSEYNNAVLIPTSKGWNGTAFDEYLLIDVMAPVGANGYDWEWGLDERQIKPIGAKANGGGVRILHVDSRLAVKTTKSVSPTEAVAVYSPLYGYDAIMEMLDLPDYGQRLNLTEIYTNSNGYEPKIEGDERWYHLLDLIPSDGSSKYRICTPSDWSMYYLFSPGDLFSTGEVFSMETMRDAFPNAPYANNGGTFDYSIKVEHYDKVNHEAIITIYRQ